MQFERRFNKIRGHSSRGDITEIAAAQFRRFVLRILRRQSGKIFARCQTNGKALDRSLFRLNDFRRGLRRSGQKEMTDTTTLWAEEIFRMRFIKTSTFRFRHFDFRRDSLGNPLPRAQIIFEQSPKRWPKKTAPGQGLCPRLLIAELRSEKIEFALQIGPR